MSSEENKKRDLKRRREPSICSTSSTDSSNTTIKPLELPWTSDDTNFLKKVITDFSCGKDHWEHRPMYWDRPFWNAIAAEYNKRASKANLEGNEKKIQGHSADEVIYKATILQMEYNLTQRMANMCKKKKITHTKTCEDCERFKALISNHHSRIKERVSQSSQSLSDGSHKRQKTNSGRSFATIGNNVNMGESSHAMNDACGDVAMAISRLLVNLREEKLLSDDEYCFLMGTRVLVEGLWPSMLLDMNNSKEKIASLLKDCFNCSVKGSKK